MSFWNDLGDFFLGSDKASKRQDELYNKIANRDNRMADFNQFAGKALNNLASRGVINSSVGSNALANASALADKTYWDNQMQLINPAFSQQDSAGFLQHLGGSVAKGIGDGVGKMFNPATWFGLG